MRPISIALLRLALPVLLSTAVNASTATADPVAGQEATPAEIMQSVFGNRLRDGGFWRQDNKDFKEGSDAPKYWMQVWRMGPGGEVVVVDAYEVNANNACSALMHIVYTYDQATGRIESHGFGANGVSGRGVIEFKGTVTTNEATIRLPGGREAKLRDREDHGASEAVVVESENWDGKAWKPGRSVTWRRSEQGLPCDSSGASKSTDP